MAPPPLALVADLATPADLLRLATVPLFGWAAYRDVRSRRVPNRTWLPVLALGLAALALDLHAAWGSPYRQPRLVRSVLLSLGLVVPTAYLLWRLGGFGGADAKALMVLAVCFPTYPVFYGPGFVLPHVQSAAGLFSLTVLTNAVIAGAVYPLGLAVRNALRGRVGAHAFVGVPVRVADLPTRHGRLLETPAGFGRSGLDLDALRMYLRWRGVSIDALRAAPDRLRDPATLPDSPGAPTDGAVDPAVDPPDDEHARPVEDPLADDATSAPSAGATYVPDEEPATGPADGGPGEHDDPWGARAFLAAIDHGAYGMTPEQLREGLDLLVERDRVWISPGIPFLLPLFVGLVVAFTYGDVLVAVLVALAGL
ncbi:MAG: prepilin peptidase [Halobacteriaceae archaeon]